MSLRPQTGLSIWAAVQQLWWLLGTARPVIVLIEIQCPAKAC